MRKCFACSDPLEDGRLLASVAFYGFDQSAFNNMAVRVHARCLTFPPLVRDAAPLPARISDPVAEPDLVEVEWEPQGWTATCRLHGEVAIKDTRDEAHMVAAIHIRRVHLPATL